jgi:hypothetical protein
MTARSTLRNRGSSTCDPIRTVTPRGITTSTSAPSLPPLAKGDGSPAQPTTSTGTKTGELAVRPPEFGTRRSRFRHW